MNKPRFNGRRIDGVTMHVLFEQVGTGVLSDEFEAFVADYFIARADRQIEKLKARRISLALKFERRPTES